MSRGKLIQSLSTIIYTRMLVCMRKSSQNASKINEGSCLHTKMLFDCSKYFFHWLNANYFVGVSISVRIAKQNMLVESWVVIPQMRLWREPNSRLRVSIDETCLSSHNIGWEKKKFRQFTHYNKIPIIKLSKDSCVLASTFVTCTSTSI